MGRQAEGSSAAASSAEWQYGLVANLAMHVYSDRKASIGSSPSEDGGGPEFRLLPPGWAMPSLDRGTRQLSRKSGDK